MYKTGLIDEPFAQDSNNWETMDAGMDGCLR